MKRLQTFPCHTSKTSCTDIKDTGEENIKAGKAHDEVLFYSKIACWDAKSPHPPSPIAGRLSSNHVSQTETGRQETTSATGVAPVPLHRNGDGI